MQVICSRKENKQKPYYAIGSNRFLHAAFPACTNIYIILNGTFELCIAAIITTPTDYIRIICIIINDCGVIYLFFFWSFFRQSKSPSFCYLTYLSYQNGIRKQTHPLYIFARLKISPKPRFQVEWLALNEGIALMQYRSQAA